MTTSNIHYFTFYYFVFDAERVNKGQAPFLARASYARNWKKNMPFIDYISFQICNLNTNL